MSLPLLQKLIGHLKWADALLLDALRRAAAPPEKALETYAHVLGAEHVWLARLHERPAGVAVWPSLRVEECEALARANAEALAAYLDAQSEESLARMVRYRNSAGAEFDTRADDILLHVAMHGQYHRAQVNLLLREAGLQPAPVDYIAYVRGAAAATRQR